MEPPTTRRRLSVSAITAAWAGPLLVVGSMLVALRRFTFQPLLTRHPDVLSLWLPTYCFLGKSLAAGHIPLWNPYSLAGTPFASDPQSGWTSLPVMTLFSALPCASALRALIVLQPMAAGLGTYWFLRGERLSRPAATVGGLAMSLGISGSDLVVSIPFAGAFAWTALLLGTASRFARSRSWSGRIAWGAVLALAWGQLADAHMSYGLVLGSGTLLAYLSLRFVASLRSGQWSWPGVLAGCALLLFALPAVNLAVLLPRWLDVSHSTLGLGYAQLAVLSESFGGTSTSAAVFTRGIGADLPLGFAVSPGLYLGAAVLALCLGGWRRARHRGLFLAFGAFGALCYVMSLQATVSLVGRRIGGSTLGAWYLHTPHDLFLGTVFVVPILGALGFEAWREAGGPLDRGFIVAAGLTIWWIVPSILDRSGSHTPLFLAGSVAGALVLALIWWKPSMAPIAACLVAIELCANSFIGQGGASPSSGAVLRPLEAPAVPADRFLQEGAIARAVASSGGRYLTLDPRGWNPIGYQTRQTLDDWPLLAMQQGMVFGLDAAQGYDSIQLPRFWEMVRSFDPKPIKYNVSYFARAPPVALDLLGVSDVIGSAAVPPVPGAFLVTSEGRWGLYGLRSPPPLASLFPSRPSWRVVGSPEAALNAVTAPRFDPERTVVLEGTPSFAAPGSRPTPSPPSSVTTIEQGAQEIRLIVDASAPAIVLIRVPFDRSWRASVDGRAATPLAADFVDQGIPVPPGHHAIELTYVDPSIGIGLAGSGIALLLLVASAVILGCRRRHGRDRTVDGAAITALSSLPV